MPLSPKQNEYIRKANCRWNLKIGAVRSGKTFVDIDTVIPMRIRELHGKSGLNVILGVSKETIERNVLQPMREIYTSRLVGTINSRNIATVCGEPVYCLGAEKISQVSKVQGSSIKYCYGDEIAKWSPEVFEMLKSRLDKPYSKFDGACNPEYPGHWLKKFLDRDDIDIYLQKYKIFDNPFLSKDFVENLCTEYAGTVYYKRYIEGEWALAEGLIYPMHKDALIEPIPLQFERYVLSIDYGTMNAFAGLLWGLSGGIWYCIDEYYHSGRNTGIQKTDEEYAQELDSFVGDKTQLKTIIDPSAASFITLLRKRDGKYLVTPADNDVREGIKETASAMRRGYIKIFKSCRNFIDELEGYVWSDSEIDDAPVKINDHACDAARYFVKTMRIMYVDNSYQSVFGR